MIVKKYIFHTLYSIFLEVYQHNLKFKRGFPGINSQSCPVQPQVANGGLSANNTENMTVDYMGCRVWRVPNFLHIYNFCRIWEKALLRWLHFHPYPTCHPFPVAVKSFQISPSFLYCMSIWLKLLLSWVCMKYLMLGIKQLLINLSQHHITKFYGNKYFAIQNELQKYIAVPSVVNLLHFLWLCFGWFHSWSIIFQTNYTFLLLCLIMITRVRGYGV